jgi:hypothetical protein
MDFIIGGAYQGKLNCARNTFAVQDNEIFTCTEESGIEFGARCINKIEEFTLWCVRNGRDATEIFKENRGKWADSVLICQDIFCGVVPLGYAMVLIAGGWLVPIAIAAGVWMLQRADLVRQGRITLACVAVRTLLPLWSTAFAMLARG